jgi:TPR repeat protein
MLIGLIGVLPTYSHACASHAKLEAPSTQALSEQNPQDAQAQYELGKTLAKNCERVEAQKWYRLAAEQGHAEAQGKLAMVYFLGLGVPVDATEGFKWLKLSAEQGNTEAAVTLGAYYAGAGLCIDCDVNYVEALKWLKPLAEQGNADAQVTLGLYVYRHDAINESNAAEDLKESRKWLRLAAKQGSVIAQMSLGEIYMQGEEGLKADKVEGVRWLHLAAEQKFKVAQFWLALAYLKGEGVKQNRKTAREWLMLAYPKIEGKEYNLERVLDSLKNTNDYETEAAALRELYQTTSKPN